MGFRHETFSALALIFLSHGAIAQERRFGAWGVGVSENKAVVYAATTNESDGFFGQVCHSSDASCAWILINGLDCQVGGKYTVLVNSEGVAAVHELACLKPDGKPRYVFSNADDITASVLKYSRIAFAFPVGDSQFQVSRFSLNGSNEALELMAKTAQKMIQQNTGRGTRDQRL